MNSKLRNILDDLTNSLVDIRTQLYLPDHKIAEAEKAIRQAVAEEMLELIEANTDHDGSARSISVAKLRQKIKQWSEETTK